MRYPSLMYGGFVETLALRFEQELQRISAEFNFDLGDEFEIACCSVLRSALPERFGVCRGFVVNRMGEAFGDDIIIFDRMMFPLLRANGQPDFGRKERVPIEAVYAYIECKHTIYLGESDCASSLKRASNQVAKVKECCSKRNKMAYAQTDPYVHRTSEAGVGPRWMPRVRNPPFGMVFSRRVALEGERHPCNDSAAIHNALLTGNELENSQFLVDVIIAGPHNTMNASYIGDDGRHQHCLFMIPEERCSFSVFHVPYLAFGIGIAHLLAALDWIRLGCMPLEFVLSEALIVLRGGDS